MNNYQNKYGYDEITTCAAIFEAKTHVINRLAIKFCNRHMKGTIIAPTADSLDITLVFSNMLYNINYDCDVEVIMTSEEFFSSDGVLIAVIKLFNKLNMPISLNELEQAFSLQMDIDRNDIRQGLMVNAAYELITETVDIPNALENIVEFYSMTEPD